MHNISPINANCHIVSHGVLFLALSPIIAPTGSQQQRHESAVSDGFIGDMYGMLSNIVDADKVYEETAQTFVRT